MKATIAEIVEHWSRQHSVKDARIDWSSAHQYCWRCRHKRRLERCHIVPASLGGPDAPSNLVLLCFRCHKEAPNHKNPVYMWQWIKATSPDFDGVYWTLRLLDTFERIFGRQPGEGLDIKPYTGLEDDFRRAMLAEVGNVVVHYGEGEVNDATMACVIAEAERVVYRFSKAPQLEGACSGQKQRQVSQRNIANGRIFPPSPASALQSPAARARRARTRRLFRGCGRGALPRSCG